MALAVPLQVKILNQVFAKCGTTGLLNMQEHHHIVAAYVELEVLLLRSSIRATMSRYLAITT